VQVEYALSVVVEVSGRVAEQHSATLPLEQGRAERHFKCLNTLANAACDNRSALAAAVKLLNSAAL